MNSAILNSTRLARRSLRVGQRVALLNVVSRTQARSFMSLETTMYTATALAEGAGWNGKTSSNGLTLNLAIPKALGGTGKGENPEQLLAMGYSSCLLGAIQAVAKDMGKADMATNAKVHVSVHIGDAKDMPGFGLGVDVRVEGVEDKLLQAGHAFCPFSRALKYGLDVKVEAKTD